MRVKPDKAKRIHVSTVVRCALAMGILVAFLLCTSRRTDAFQALNCDQMKRNLVRMLSYNPNGYYMFVHGSGGTTTDMLSREILTHHRDDRV